MCTKDSPTERFSTELAQPSSEAKLLRRPKKQNREYLINHCYSICWKLISSSEWEKSSWVGTKRHWEKMPNVDPDGILVMSKFPGRATTPATLFKKMFYLLWLCQQWISKALQAKCCRCTFPKCQQHELPPASDACFTLLLSEGRAYCRPGVVDSLCTYHSLCTGFPVWLLLG